MINIDENVLRLIGEVEEELTRFRGIRSLWAETVANHVPFVASEKDLRDRQYQALRQAVYFSLCLYKRLWPGKDSPHAAYRLLSLDKTPITNGIADSFDMIAEIHLEGDAPAHMKAMDLKSVVTGLVTADTHDDREELLKKLFVLAGLKA
jgi:hypothetical protein